MTGEAAAAPMPHAPGKANYMIDVDIKRELIPGNEDHSVAFVGPSSLPLNSTSHSGKIASNSGVQRFLFFCHTHRTHLQALPRGI